MAGSYPESKSLEHKLIQEYAQFLDEHGDDEFKLLQHEFIIPSKGELQRKKIGLGENSICFFEPACI